MVWQSIMLFLSFNCKHLKSNLHYYLRKLILKSKDGLVMKFISCSWDTILDQWEEVEKLSLLIILIQKSLKRKILSNNGLIHSTTYLLYRDSLNCFSINSRTFSPLMTTTKIYFLNKVRLKPSFIMSSTLMIMKLTWSYSSSSILPTEEKKV